MTNEKSQQPELLVSRDDVAAILALTNLPVRGPVSYQEVLREHLRSYLHRVVAEAPKRRHLNSEEVTSVRVLHDKFDALLKSLQDTSAAPPMLDWRTNEAGREVNSWTQWLDREYLKENHRPEQVNWRLVFELIAFYELLYSRNASMSSPTGPTSRFLRGCIDLLRSRISPPSEVAQPWYCLMPSNDAMKDKLKLVKSDTLSAIRERLLCECGIQKGG